tara:strand:- start:25508 stop:26269 length:762 start_codon:yes stop_codon:yes gene_type:complete
MNLTAEQLQENWNKVEQIINDNFQGKRKERLLDLYSKFKERIMTAPASGIEYYHNCFPGGYLDHVLRVVDCTQKLFKLWKECGATIDYTDEELMFVALNHDLGKIGDMNNEYYIPNSSEWHRKNQGKIYVPNPDITHMSVPHRGIWLLQNYGITLTQNEMIGIMIHDGAYDDANSTYLKAYAPERRLRTNLPLVIHHADHMASRIELETWEKEGIKQIKPNFNNTSKKNNLRNLANKNTSSSSSKLFDDLFKE